MNNPLTIVAAMRSGAREYLEQHTTSEAILEALTRFATSRSKARASAGRARVFTVMNAKGGAGSTTIAVNTAVALQEAHGGVLLVDFSPLGHAALHLNARPSFGLRDTLQNLHRMDASLLEGFMTQCKGGLQLLAGSQSPQALTPAAAELARLFDLLVAHFRYVVVDCSNRVDQTRGCFAISQVPRSWSRKRMSCRCGAQTGFAPTWKKAAVTIESGWCSTVTRRFLDLLTKILRRPPTASCFGSSLITINRLHRPLIRDRRWHFMKARNWAVLFV